jgi:hypothetical protein
MSIRNSQEYTILDAVGPAATGKAILIEDFKHAVFSFATDGGGDAALTVKFQGSVADECPDFSAAQAADNMWDYVEVVDLEDGTAIDGDTGVAVATADDYRLLEANINGLKWVCATVTARTAGEVTVKVRTFHE